MADITAIILTKDEEKNIERCLRSIEKLAVRRIVVDSGSTDRTIPIARSLGAEVLVHPFENYARQFNWGIDNGGIQSKWILRIDADEAFPPELCAAVERALAEHADDDVNGIMLSANLFFMGRKLAHGKQKKRKIMIFRTGFGRIEDRQMDEHTMVDGGRVIELAEKFDHYDFKDLTNWLSKMNWYATREMQDYFATMDALQANSAVAGRQIAGLRKKKFGLYYRMPMFIRCWMLFIYQYIFRGGFLDGVEGFLYYWLYNCWYRMIVDAKILEQKKNPQPLTVAGPLGKADIDAAKKAARQ